MSDATNATSAASDTDSLQQGMTGVAIWIAKIKKAQKDEEKWRKAADEAIRLFEADEQVDVAFNLFFSNIETLVPALYNSTPVPDVRVRYADHDPVARLGSETITRLISCSLDTYDFDDVMVATVQDGTLPGRGQARVRFSADTEPMVDENGKQQGERSTNEKCWTEIVPWNRYVQGPALIWDDVPWLAFQHDLTKDALRQLIGEADDTEARIELIGLAGQSKETEKQDDKKPEIASGVYHTVPCYEVWDKASKQVFWITERDTLKPLAVKPDPLQLSSFFPVPRPLQQVRRAGSLKPICPHVAYKSLLDELDSVTKRIKANIAQVKVRGIVDPALETALSQLELASDGQYVAGTSAEDFVQGSPKLTDRIAHWPLDEVVKALASLYQQRELIKQSIYEVTGLSDIIRGATDANETATAQSIKARWGTQRVQRMQADVARFARDLFRLKAEVMLNLFTWETIKERTRMQFVPQEAPSQIPQQPMDGMQPQQMPGMPANGAAGGPQMPMQPPMGQQQPVDLEEQVREVLQSAKARAYLIDIETDSTIRADMSRDQEQMNLFLQGTAQFVQALGSAGQIMPQVVPHLVALYTAFAGKFKLGKQAEDALEAMMVAGKQGVVDPNAGQDVEGLKAQLEQAVGEVQRLTQELQAADVDLKKHGMALENAKEIEGIRVSSAERQKAAELESNERLTIGKLQADAGLAANKTAADGEKAQVPIIVKQMDLQHATVENEKDRQAALEQKAYEAALAPKPSESGATP